MMRQKTHDYLSVLKHRSGNNIHYSSNLELTAPMVASSPPVANPAVSISRKQIHDHALAALPAIHRSSKPTSRVVNVSFVINGNVAEMEHYHREHTTPLSAKLRLDTLITVANDLKGMGCDEVLTHVFIPGRNSAAGQDQPVLMKIDGWISYLCAYESPNEFAGQQPL